MSTSPGQVRDAGRGEHGRPAGTFTPGKTGIVLIASGALAVAAAGYGLLTSEDGNVGGTQQGVAAEAATPFPLHPSPREVADLSFIDGEGRDRTLSSFGGQTILLNVWATWCIPCREEMPALDRLEEALGGPRFAVVPLSIDRGGLEDVKAFYREHGIRALQAYVDPTGKATRGLAAVGIPTTLLIGPDGRELGRLTGPDQWDGPEMQAFIEGQLAKATPDQTNL